MTLKGYLKYVEIQTKVASIIPFILGTLYAVYRYGEFNLVNFIIMLISLLSFDMATTAINNYIDFKKSDFGNGSEKKGTYIQEGISQKTGIIIIYTLLAFAVLFGIMLTVRTNLAVLLIGMIAFGVGIFYTFGPVPISRMPLGELFSGLFMGFVILFLSVFIHIGDKRIVDFYIINWNLSLNINIKECINIFMISVPAVSAIANIMLANNICDIEEDIKIKRFTLPYYIGRPKALLLFKALYYAGYLDVIAMLLLRIVPITFTIVLLTILPVNSAINLFIKKQEKTSTFALSIKNFVIMVGSEILSIALALLLKSK